MKLRDKKTGSIELFAAIMIAVIGVLIIVGIIALIKHLPDTSEPIYRTTTIVKKHIREAGMTCYELILMHCNKDYEYFINNKKVSEDIYNSVQEGETYLCTEDYKCKELEDGK